MSNSKKRLIRVSLAAAGIMMAFTTVPDSVTGWVQAAGGWLTILITAAFSNSDFKKES